MCFVQSKESYNLTKEIEKHRKEAFEKVNSEASRVGVCSSLRLLPPPPPSTSSLNLLPPPHTNCENMAYRSLRSEKCSDRAPPPPSASSLQLLPPPPPMICVIVNSLFDCMCLLLAPPPPIVCGAAP